MFSLAVRNMLCNWLQKNTSPPTKKPPLKFTLEMVSEAAKDAFAEIIVKAG